MKPDPKEQKLYEFLQKYQPNTPMFLKMIEEKVNLIIRTKITKKDHKILKDCGILWEDKE